MPRTPTARRKGDDLAYRCEQETIFLVPSRILQTDALSRVVGGWRQRLSRTSTLMVRITDYETPGRDREPTRLIAVSSVSVSHRGTPSPIAMHSVAGSQWVTPGS